MSNTSVLLVSHYATFSPQDLLEQYFTDERVSYLSVINLPLPEQRMQDTIVRKIYRDGIALKTQTYPSRITPVFLSYLLHMVQLVGLLCTEPVFDIAIAQNSMIGFVLVLFRYIGRIKRFIYYSHGVAGNRFQRGLSNRVYQWLDTFVATHADRNWVLSDAMLPVRKAQGLDMSHVHVVPIDFPKGYFAYESKAKTNDIMYLGSLDDLHGAELLPDILQQLKQHKWKGRLDIIGDGTYKPTLVERSQELGISDHIRFVANKFDLVTHKDVLTRYLCGLAPYHLPKGTLLYRTDPQKVKMYLYAGLPVVISGKLLISDIITKRNMGVVVSYDASEFADAIISMTKPKNHTATYRKNERIFRDEHDIFQTYKAAIAS